MLSYKIDLGAHLYYILGGKHGTAQPHRWGLLPWKLGGVGNIFSCLSHVESACNKFSLKKKMSSDLLAEESVCQWFDCGKQLPPVSDLCLLGGCLQKVQLS